MATRTEPLCWNAELFRVDGLLYAKVRCFYRREVHALGPYGPLLLIKDHIDQRGQRMFRIMPPDHAGTTVRKAHQRSQRVDADKTDESFQILIAVDRTAPGVEQRHGMGWRGLKGMSAGMAERIKTVGKRKDASEQAPLHGCDPVRIAFAVMLLVVFAHGPQHALGQSALPPQQCLAFQRMRGKKALFLWSQIRTLSGQLHGQAGLTQVMQQTGQAELHHIFPRQAQVLTKGSGKHRNIDGMGVQPGTSIFQ